MKRTVGALTAVGIMLAAAAVYAQAEPAAAKPGEAAPDFTLSDLKGNTHTLSDAKGKYVVLEWTNYDCPFVKKYYDKGHMQALQAKWAGKGAVWLTICSSAPGKQGHFTSEQWTARLAVANPNAPVLLDPDGKVGRLYAARTTPHMYVIAPDGTLVYAGAIDNKRSANTDDIATSLNYVEAAIEAHMAGKPVDPASTAPYGCSVKY